MIFSTIPPDAWVTRDGRAIPIAKMEDSHLLNAIRFLRRRNRAAVRAIAWRDALGAASYASTAPDGAADAALEDATRTLEGARDDAILEERLAAFGALLDEAHRRKLEVYMSETKTTGPWTAFQLPNAPGWQVTVQPGDGRPSAMTEAQAGFVAACFNLAAVVGETILTTEWMTAALEAMTARDRARSTGSVWRPIATAPRSAGLRKNRYVLVRGPSTYVGTKHFVVLAYHDDQYRPLDPWRLLDNSALSDFGWVPEEWTEVPE